MSSSPLATPASAGARTVAGQLPAEGARGFAEMFRPYFGRAFVGFLFLLGTVALQLVLPRLINQGIDLAEGKALDEGSLLSLLGVDAPRVVHVAVFIILLALVAGALRVMSRISLFNVGRDVERDLRRDLFSHLSTLSPTYYGQHPIGDVMSRLTNDLTNIRLMAGFALLNVLNALIFFVGTLPLLFSLDVTVTLAALVPFPLVMGLSQGMSRMMYRRTRENQEMLGRVTTAVQENLAGQQVVRAFSQQAGEEERFARVNDEAYGAAMRLAVVRLIMFPLTSLMGALGIGITLYMAGRAITFGRMDVGDFVEFSGRLMQLIWPTIALGFIISVYQRGKASIERINDVFRETPDLIDGAHRGAFAGRVTAEGLTVSYPGSEQPALVGLDFEVAPGKTLGVVGRNASGKSTLVRALSRLCPVEPEQLFFDGVDAVDWHLGDLRSGIAIVPDDGFLFSATLRENLAFARPDATEAEVRAAVETADLVRDVSQFPDGLDTVVGERGVTLSGGQRQRVALARALLALPRLLVLDDSLSAVDAETETRIVTALRSGRFSMGGEPPALIIISHRLSAVREADEIVVLEEGRVIERGRHDALLEQGGRYADLWGREQLKKKLASETAGGE